MSFYVVLPIFLVFASTGSLVVKPNIKLREKKSNDWADLWALLSIGLQAGSRYKGKKHENRKFRCRRMAK